MLNNKPVLIIGAGDHSKVLLDILLDQNIKVIGFTDKNIPKGTLIYDIPVIGDDSVYTNYKTNEVELVNGIGSIGKTSLREYFFTSLKEQGYSFKSIIHPSAIISKRVKLGEGVQILAGSVINIESVIGNNSIVNTKSSVDHGCVIGNHCHIAPGCTLSGCVTVGDRTHIGTGTAIIQGIKIGSNVIIGAGSVVVHNIKDNEKAFGVPARVRK